MKPRLLLAAPALVVLVAVAMAGCASEDPPPGASTSGSPQPPSLTATPLTPSASPSPTGRVPAEVAGSPKVQAAVTDLAGRLGVPPSEVEVVQVSEVTWPDGSLGCPKPGMSYTQSLQNGQLVLLSVDGRTYEYHSGPNRPLFYCEDPHAPATSSAGAGPA